MTFQIADCIFNSFPFKHTHSKKTYVLKYLYIQISIAHIYSYDLQLLQKNIYKIYFLFIKNRKLKTKLLFNVQVCMTNLLSLIYKHFVIIQNIAPQHIYSQTLISMEKKIYTIWKELKGNKKSSSFEKLFVILLALGSL